MRDKIIQAIAASVEEANDRKAAPTWLTPLVGFADAGDPLFEQLKTAVRPSHSLPGDLLPGARTVIAYFLPFDRAVCRENHHGEYASETWAAAYVETNQLIAEINGRLNDALESEGLRGTRLPATHNFDEETLMSDWSHKHAAYIAGLGDFGRHHMLITDRGCCGRLGSVVTDAVIAPTPREDRVRCLFKHDGSCRACEARCPTGALADPPFDRRACYGRLMENARLHDHLGLGLADVCGKCAAVVPCSFRDPVKALTDKGRP